MYLFKKIRELWSDKNGQVLALVLAILFVLVLFFVTIPCVTKVTSDKIRTQTAADAGAFSAASWMARGLNTIYFINNGIEAMYIDMIAITVVWTVAGALATIPITKAAGEGICLGIFGKSPTVDRKEYMDALTDKVDKLYNTAKMLSDFYEHIQQVTPIIAKNEAERIVQTNLSMWDNDVEFCVKTRIDKIELKDDGLVATVLATLANITANIASILGKIANIGNVVMNPLEGIKVSIEVKNIVRIDQRWRYYVKDPEGGGHWEYRIYKQRWDLEEHPNENPEVWMPYYDDPVNNPVEGVPPDAEYDNWKNLIYEVKPGTPPLDFEWKKEDVIIPKVVKWDTAYTICFVKRPVTLPILGRNNVFNNVTSPYESFAVSQAAVYKEKELKFQVGNITIPIPELPEWLSCYDLKWTARLATIYEADGLTHIKDILHENNIGGDIGLDNLDSLLLH